MKCPPKRNCLPRIADVETFHDDDYMEQVASSDIYDFYGGARLVDSDIDALTSPDKLSNIPNTNTMAVSNTAESTQMVKNAVDPVATPMSTGKKVAIAGGIIAAFMFLQD